MITLITLLLILLAIFLAVGGYFQTKQKKEKELKLAIVSKQTKNISAIEGVIVDAESLPISPKTLIILYNRINYAYSLMLQCYPKRTEFIQGSIKTKEIINNLNLTMPSEELPSVSSEQHMIHMIRTLKKIRTILNAEGKRVPHHSPIIIAELVRVDFFITYLTSKNLIERADKSFASGSKGTSREGYESAIKILNTCHSESNRIWIEDKLHYCHSQLENIHSSMVNANHEHIRKSSFAEIDHTGLSRMSSQTKSKLIYATG